MISRTEKFGNEKCLGEALLLGDGSYVMALKTMGRVSLIYTSKPDCSEVTTALVGQYEPQIERGTGELSLLKPNEDGDFHAEGSGSEVCEYVLANQHNIGAFTISLGETRFSWQLSGSRRFSGSGEQESISFNVSEGGISLPQNYSPEAASELVLVTATDGLTDSLETWWPRLEYIRPLH